MIAWLAALASASPPPRGEVFAGWGGNAAQSYGMIVAQPALVRMHDAGFAVRAAVSQLHYRYTADGQQNDVSGPGLSLGPAFTYRPGDWSLGFAVGLGARASTLRAGADERDRDLFLEATFAGDVSWRPQQRAQLGASFSLNAGDQYLWARLGASHPVLSLIRADAPFDVWVGLEATTGGTFDVRTYELGPVASVSLPALGASISARGGIALARDAGEGAQPLRGTFGLGLYWSY